MVEKFEEQINGLILEMCGYLKITPPNVRYVLSKEKGAIASTTYDKNKDSYLMTIDKNVDDIRDAYFFVFHEIRHVWQRVTNPKLYFENYAQLQEIGEDAYYSQIAEIDANAFALALMKGKYSLVPKVTTMPKDILDIVLVREKKLRKEWVLSHSQKIATKS